MRRMDIALRSGAALAAIMVGASAAAAQSTIPPVVERAQASPVTTVTEQDIVVTGSRIRHNPLESSTSAVAANG